ncbi:uncharacterized protein LOC142787116 [Rhipicephalus microplus]|uniref:uncharacterized protein LOC142787116 n=1 Tax=Rhipicephalus microplus TaxID=6941 RepID=UPI003F6D855A
MASYGSALPALVATAAFVLGCLVGEYTVRINVAGLAQCALGLHLSNGHIKVSVTRFPRCVRIAAVLLPTYVAPTPILGRYVIGLCGHNISEIMIGTWEMVLIKNY